LGLLDVLGIQTFHSVIGHDLSTPAVSYCALILPDIFKSVALMRAPFTGSASVLFGSNCSQEKGPNIHQQLVALSRPRKHYQWYYLNSEASGTMQNCPQEVHDFMRTYYHYKSLDWTGNTPSPCRVGWPKPLLKKYQAQKKSFCVNGSPSRGYKYMATPMHTQASKVGFNVTGTSHVELTHKI